MQTLNPGDVEVKKMELRHSNGVLNLVGYVLEFNIFESITAPTIKANMIMHDATGVLDNLMLAFSDVEVEFTSYGGHSMKHKFKVSSINGGSPSDLGKSKDYVVDLVTQDYINSAAANITENFVDLEHEKMIAIIINGYLKSQKKLNFEKTLGVDFVPVTKMKPLQAIDKIRRRSVSLTRKSSSYCFYENLYGYNFTTIEQMMVDGKKSAGDRNFFMNSANKKNFQDSDWRNIIGFNQVSNQNLIQTLAQGGVRNVTWAYNIETGEYKRSDFDLNRDGGAYANPGAYHVSKEVSSRYADTEAVNTLIPINNEIEMARVDKNSFMKPYLMKLLSNIINVHIYGDSTLGAGAVIHVDFPKLDGLSTMTPNELLTGFYLITKIRHIIIPTGKPKYTQSCEILREGFYGD